MITGAPAPSPTFLGSDSFLACGRLPACGCPRIVRWGERLYTGARTRVLPILSSPRLRLPSDCALGRAPLHWRPDPRTADLVVASPAVSLGLCRRAAGQKH